MVNTQSRWLHLTLRLQHEPPSRELDKECAEFFGWRVGKDQWWVYHDPQPSPAEDDWAMRLDGRDDLMLDQPLPKFSLDLMLGIQLGLSAKTSKNS